MSRPAVRQRRVGALILWHEAARVNLCLPGLVFRANSKTYCSSSRTFLSAAVGRERGFDIKDKKDNRQLVTSVP